MNRLARLKLNKRLMFGARFFTEIKSLNSVLQLFYLSRGLDISQIIYLGLFWTITVFFCDLPSSFLADKFGRKKLILSGIFLMTLSTFLLLIATSFPGFVIAYITAGAGFSFFMGADQAIIYDSLKEMGEEDRSNKVAGKYYSAQSLPKIVMPLIGGFIAKDLLPSQFNILLFIDLIGTVIAFTLASFLTEPKVETVKRKTIAFLKEGVKLIKDNQVLLKLAFNKIVVFQASYVYWRVYQIFLKDAGMLVVYLGLVYTVFQGIQFLLLWYTEKVQNYFGKVVFANTHAILGFLAIIFSLFSQNLIILFICCVVLLLTGVSRDPFFLSQIQARIPSFNRATVTSTLNALKNLSDIPLLLLIGYLAKNNINYVLLVSGILFLISIIFLRIKKEDLVV